jgi:hypothetical protein
MRKFLAEAVRQSPDIERQADVLMVEFFGRVAGPVVSPLDGGEVLAVRMDPRMSSHFARLVWNLAESHRAEMAMPDIIETIRAQVAQLLAEIAPVSAERAEAIDQAVAVSVDPEITEGLEKASNTILRVGVAGMSPGLLLLLVLTWLIAVGLPVAQAELPEAGQIVATNEVATVGLALAITWRLLDTRGK